MLIIIKILNINLKIFNNYKLELAKSFENKI